MAGAVVGTVVVTTLFESLQTAENAINLAQLFPETLVGFTEVCLSIAMILILIYRPAGIMGGQEFR